LTNVQRVLLARCRYFCPRQTQPRSRPFSTPAKVNFATKEKKSKLRAFARVDRLGGRHGRLGLPQLLCTLPSAQRKNECLKCQVSHEKTLGLPRRLFDQSGQSGVELFSFFFRLFDLVGQARAVSLPDAFDRVKKARHFFLFRFTRGAQVTRKRVANADDVKM